MSKDPAFLFYPGDYLRDTQCLSEKTQVAYDRIMCEHMRNICISQQQLNFFTKRLSDEEKEELKMLLTENENGFEITWVAESIIKRKEYSDSRRKNRIKKEITYDKDMKTYISHMENENENENEIIIDNKIKIKTWKNNFDLYLENAKLAFSSLLTEDYIKERESYHPNLDIKKTIEKSCNDYWFKEAGWKNKKLKKTIEINWLSTFNNALSQKMNQVWKTNNKPFLDKSDRSREAEIKIREKYGITD